MDTTTRVWAPSDKGLTVEEQKVLSLTVSLTQKVDNRDLLEMLLVRKLIKLMEEAEDVEGALAIAPGLTVNIDQGMSHKQMAQSWMMESSLSALLYQVNLKAPNLPASPEVKRAHQNQTLESLLESLTSNGD